jgi:tetratricopeptide (TPR) repeat protein
MFFPFIFSPVIRGIARFIATCSVPLRAPTRTRNTALFLLILSGLGTAILAQPDTSKSTEIRTHLEQARAALQANDFRIAADQLRAVLALDGSNLEAHEDLATIAFFQGDCPAAERDLHSAIQIAPAEMKPQALLALCAKRMNQPSAQAMLEKVFSSLQDTKLRTEVGVELADIYYQQRELDKTASIMQTLVALAPDNVDILFFAQRVYSELADNTLNKLAILAPGSARMEQLIAERLINAGDSADAIPHYRKAISQNPKLPGMHFELAEALMQSSNNPQTLAEAKHEFSEALNIDGESASIEDALGQIAMKTSPAITEEAAWNEALAHFKKAYAINPKDADAAMGIARSLKMQDKPQEALDYLRLAVREDPMNFEAHYQLAQVCRDLHLADEEQRELRLYHAAKAAKDSAEDLHREMNPHTTATQTASSAP